MTTAIAPRTPSASTIEEVLAQGDLSKLTSEQRTQYLLKVCESLGLNAFTQPFKYLLLDGKLTLYATKDCTEQLRKLHHVSVTDITTSRVDDIYVVVAKVQDKTGRTDASTGALGVGTLKGNALANAIMKCETKAKRRATLSICGLGILDESEIETIKGAVVTVPTEVSTTPLLDAAAEPEPAPEPPKEPRTFLDCVITQVEAKRARSGIVSWAEVSFTGVDTDGVEVTLTLPTLADAKEASLSLAEQLYQNGERVAIHTNFGKRNGREGIIKFVRARTPGEDDVPPSDITASDIGF